MDSLTIGSKDSNYMNDLFNLQKNDKVLAQSNNSMPVFKPSYDSTMPIHKIDTTSIYFMRVYPNTKD
ncbi:hypothetical protein ACFSQJ_06660 [Croceitalea marina]|uniref:Uncharacterized protein n=1 Tax=Croceitalea marina TaxID=1775166 RepID=A0ABW5MTZ1_9FLAO